MIENPEGNTLTEENQTKRPVSLDLNSSSWDADSENSLLSTESTREELNSPTTHINKSPEVSVSLISNNSGDSAFHEESVENLTAKSEDLLSDVPSINADHLKEEILQIDFVKEESVYVEGGSSDEGEDMQEENVRSEHEDEEEGVDFEEFQIDTRPPRFEKYDYNPREKICAVEQPRVEINRGLTVELPVTPKPEVGEGDLSYETIIDKEIRLQQAKEDRLAMERQLAQEDVQQRFVSSKTSKVSNCTAKVQEKKNDLKHNVIDKTVRPIYRQLSKDRGNSNPTEARIAMEIQEIQLREQELKETRERFGSMENILDELKGGDNHLETSSLDSRKLGVNENGLSDHISSSAEVLEASSSSRLTPEQRATSLDSVSSGYSSTTEMNHKKIRKVSVKPLLDEIEDNKPSYRLMTESAVEREIRLTLDREEQLRKQRSLSYGQQEHQAKPNIENSNEAISNNERNNSIDEAKKQPNDNNKPVPEKKYTQRRIATTRIQQEIEEQIQREQALRELGVIKTTSEDHLDSRVARFGETELIPNTFGERFQGKPVLDRQNSSDSILASSTTSSHKTYSVSMSNGNHRATVSTTSPSNPMDIPFMKSGGALSITPVSPVGNITRVVSPFRKNSSHSATVGRAGVMEKFINSRGKMNVVPAFISHHNDKPEVPLNQGVVKQSVGTVLETTSHEASLKPTTAPTYKKNTYRTESKIQAELKEMRVREEELRLIRSKCMGRSQPNLLALDDDMAITNSPRHQNGLSRVMSSSNPNLLDDSNDSVQCNLHQKLGKRSSTLIQQWEEMIKNNE